MNNILEKADYPALYQIADESSLQGQRRYLLFFKLELLMLILGAIVSLFPLENPDYGDFLAIFSALLFACAIAITVGMKSMKLENNWYIGRAIAESLKTLTWRFITKGEPFLSEKPQEEIDKRFCSILGEILATHGDYLDLTAQQKDGDLQITEKMHQVRDMEFDKRKEIYILHRVKDQLGWYQRKAKFSKDKANTFFILLILLQTSALAYSLYLVTNPGMFNVVPLITTIASAIISWGQVKQFEELAQAYSTTAQEITLILAQVKYIDTEDKFSVFVADTENAFSREHTLWLARKDVYNYSSKIN